ncbi:hypothetical protein HZH66_001687 [Vespula vulgaris]|uniref:Phorbol-ester/DAG-type domain-containing protein n=1 Tax=Vespula vulgaris TaxID=7454 RepID=A0A834NFK0_VESVU|nr:hypothetical protein HZH66_001687 [Vespula vulgaris]
MASVSAETRAIHGHSFSKKTFHKPTYCHNCTDMLWGLIQQGYICEGFDASINFWVDYTIQGKTNRAPTDRCIHPNVQCTWLNSSTMKDYFLRPGRSHR